MVAPVSDSIDRALAHYNEAAQNINRGTRVKFDYETSDFASHRTSIRMKVSWRQSHITWKTTSKNRPCRQANLLSKDDAVLCSNYGLPARREISTSHPDVKAPPPLPRPTDMKHVRRPTLTRIPPRFAYRKPGTLVRRQWVFKAVLPSKVERIGAPFVEHNYRSLTNVFIGIR